MNQNLSHIDQVADPAEQSSGSITDDYGEILREFGFTFVEAGHQYQIGKMDWVQGWVLEISVIVYQVKHLLTRILPLLKEENSVFKIVKNRDIAKTILDGYWGYTELGKIISIYPSTNNQAAFLAKHLISLTIGFKGPSILTNKHLGSVVFTRYGSCRPIIRKSNSGVDENYIYDPYGNLIKDQYIIPFVVPKGVEWPFSKIQSSESPTPETILQDRFKPIAILKEDARGRVMKTLWLKKWLRVKLCVIKEGKKGMNGDDYGRDVGDRLRWQFELHKDLQSIVPIPKAYEVFTENEDTYLVMEYVKGKQLETVLLDTFQRRLWPEIPLPDRKKLVGYCLEIVEMIHTIQRNGFVHRDINPGNFIVTKEHRIYMIDLELSYSITKAKPYPPFRFGTAWFMSPEQQATITPTAKEDIYALGATLIVLLTGLLPSKFAVTSPADLTRQLKFIIGENEIITTVVSCLSNNPEERPSIDFLRNQIIRLRESQVEYTKFTKQNKVNKASSETIHNAITDAISGLSVAPLLTKGYLWWSKTVQELDVAYYQNESGNIYGGFQIGVGGVLFVLARAHKMGYSIRSCMGDFREGLKFIRDQYTAKLPEVSAGLYGGTAGIALAVIEGIEAGLIPFDGPIMKDLQFCLNQEKINGLGVAKGLAGIGIVLLKSLNTMGNEFVQPIVDSHISYLLDQQQNDGSWLIRTDDGKDLLKFTGFGHGTAGITCFLLAYYQRTKNNSVENAARKALEWLRKQAHKKNGNLIWYLHNKTKDCSMSTHEGQIGIAIAFIQSYRMFKDPIHLQLAETILRGFPEHFVSRDLTLSHGLVGLGEAYLEAMTAFKNEEWKQRADWIAQFVLHQHQRLDDGSIYWLIDQTPISTADLMCGNSGVLHFLLRYSNPYLLSHPMLPVSNENI